MTALVVLARRVEVPRAEAERRLHPGVPGDERTEVDRLGVAEPIEVGLDGDIAVLVDLCEELTEGPDEVVGLIDVAVDLDGAVDERRDLLGVGARVEGLPGERLRRLDIRLIERVDPDAVAGDRGGELPEEELLAQIAVDLGIEARGRADRRGRAEGAEQGIGAGVGEADITGFVEDDGEDPLPVLAERFRDELLDPGAQTGKGRRGGGEDELLRGPGVGDAQPGAEPQRRVVRAVSAEVGGDARRGLDDPADVDPGETGGDEAERGERTEPAADVRVGVERREVPFGTRELSEFGPGIGDRDEPAGRVDADGLEGRGERAPDGIGLDRRPRLRGDDEDGVVEVGADRLGDLIGIGRIDDLEVDPGPRRHHLGGERRAAHAGEADRAQTLRGEIVAQRLDLGDELTGPAREIDPAETIGGDGVGEDARVLRRDPRGHPGAEQTVEFGLELRTDGDAELDSHARSNARRTVPWSSVQLTSNFSRPSVSRTVMTSA